MTTPDSATTRELVRLACQAPSIHNTQPWSWVVSDDTLELHAATGRHLKHTDPDGRDLVVSCGAALHQLVVAAAGNGWSCDVERLPVPNNRNHLASVTFDSHVTDAVDTALLRAIAQRRTDRRQVSSWEVPRARLAQFVDIAAQFGVVASVQPSGSDTLVRRLLREASELHDADEACRAELLHWTRPFARDEGVPLRNLLTPSAAIKGDGTRFPAGSLSDDHEESASAHPSWIVLATASDDRLSWLRVGEALDAIWLACTVAGLSVVPFSEPIEVESTRSVLKQDMLNGSCLPQLLIRVGWPPVLSAAVPPTPRRPLDEVFEVTGSAHGRRVPHRRSR